MSQNSNILELHEHIKFVCQKKLIEDNVREMSANIRPRPFCVTTFYVKYKDYNAGYYNLSSCFVWGEQWSLTLRGHSFRVLENRVLRNIFGPNKQEAGEGCIERCLVLYQIDRSCGTWVYGGEDKSILGFDEENCERRPHEITRH